MEESTSGNAITEVALALAMAFFAMMVLAMVSMSVPARNQITENSEAVTIEAVAVVDSAAKDSTTSQPMVAEDRLIIFHAGNFYDRQLHLLNPVDLDDSDSRIVLAMAADLSLQASLAARAQIPVKNLIITQLDSKWQQTMEELIP